MKKFHILYLALFLSNVLQANILKIYLDKNENRLNYISTTYQYNSYLNGITSFNSVKFSGKIKNNFSTQYTSSPTDSIHIFGLNKIYDSTFIYQNQILDNDTIHCYQYGIGSFGFEYNSHIIDYPNNKLYRLLLDYQFESSYYNSNCYRNYYLVKSSYRDTASQYITFNSNSQPYYPQMNDTIENFIKISYRISDIPKLYKKNNDEILLINNQYISNDNYKFTFVNIDKDLSILDSSQLSFTRNVYLFDYKSINHKNYLITDNIIWKLDDNYAIVDSIVTTNEFEKTNYFNSLEQIHYLFYTQDSTTIVKVTNQQNDTIRTVTLPTTNTILVTKDSNFIMIKAEYTPHYDDDIYTDAFIYEWTKNGNFINKTSLTKLKLINLYDFNTPILNYAIDTFDNILLGYSIDYDNNGNIAYIQDYSIFLNLMATHFISGKITQDINKNCTADSTEPNIKNILVELQLNNKSYYTLSDDSGKYKFTPYDTGHGKVILHLENQTAFTNACQDTFNVFISDTLQNPIVDFLLQTTTCNSPVPKVRVNISTPFLRRCFDNIYTLSLTNESNDTAFNTYVDVELDDDLIALDTAFATAQNLGNNTYRFSIGQLNPLETFRKNLLVNVNCTTTILGQTHCVKATSHPYEICAIIDAKYMQAEATCRNDSVIFNIKNIGYPEIFQQSYRVIADDSILTTGTLNFTQSIGFSNLSFYNPTGKTYRLETRQYPMFIGEDTILSVAIEGCGNTNFSTGFITRFSQDDDAPNVSIDCHQNVGSFDPNDKSANPLGYGNNHLVENKQAIEYTIHFQNLGTYPASFVSIIDTLSTNFDITTFKILGSSHAYSVSIIDSNILQFKFYNINLIDATTDSLLSNGFIKFSIKPKTNTAIGSDLNNNAFITFDYNKAVETNLVQHQIGKDFLKPSILTITKNNLFKDVQVKIYPNPTSNHFVFEITKEVPKNANLSFYSVDGKVILKLNNLSLINQINTEYWSKGIYLFELKSENSTIQSGKIILE